MGQIDVQLDSNNDDARKARSTHGVSSIFGVGNWTGAFPDAFFEAMCNSMYEIHNQASIDLTPRQKMGIARGPFSALVAELIRVDAK